MKSNSSAFFAIILCMSGLTGCLHAAVDLVDSSAVASPCFPLVAGGVAAPIVLPVNAPEVVRIAAGDLARDIAAVTGKTPEILTKLSAVPESPRVELVLPPDLAGKWEGFRLSAKPGILTIAGSDRRGLAFGIYEVSRRIGVSPWHWWADVPVKRRGELKLTTGDGPVEQPSVKYRGIFINDEDWGLQPWAAKTFEPEVGNIGPKTYGKVFELLLRLRANTVWPGMHPTTTPFHLVPGNAAIADRYAIVVGSSHAEPMLRTNGGEWKLPEKDFNYLTHRNEVLQYWEERVKERASGESLFTIGMRGIHDSPIIGPKTEAERVATVEKVFADQRGLLGKYLGKGDATKVGQIFCPYKEVLDTYNAGLKVPDDVSIVWPDDNYGYIRRFSTPAERKRSGGLGVYYHVSYSGLPFSWLWIDTLPPALTWSEMTRAYQQGANGVWIVNVGDIKNTERSAEFFLDLAWHANRTDIGAPDRFMRETAARDFGKEYADAIVDILRRLQAINFARKTEHLQWHPSLEPYKPTQLNETEIAQRLKACAELQRDSDALSNKLPPEARDAYFELVGYPVGITAAANERYFRAELARADVARDRSPESNKSAAKQGEKRVDDLTARYNKDIAGGKWRNIATENGVSPKEWKRFQRDTKTVPPPPAADNVCPPAPAAVGALPRSPAAKSGDFVERDGVVSIDASHFSGKKDLPSGAGWRSVPGLGRSGSAVTVMPSTARISASATPSLDYRFHVSSELPATLRVRLLPTHPLVSGRGLRLAVSIDGGAPLSLEVTKGFDPKKPEWSDRVLANATEASLKLPVPLKPGAHVLRLIAVDAGVVVDKIVIDLGGLQPSYDGPAETRHP